MVRSRSLQLPKVVVCSKLACVHDPWWPLSTSGSAFKPYRYFLGNGNHPIAPNITRIKISFQKISKNLCICDAKFSSVIVFFSRAIVSALNEMFNCYHDILCSVTSSVTSMILHINEKFLELKTEILMKNGKQPYTHDINTSKLTFHYSKEDQKILKILKNLCICYAKFSSVIVFFFRAQ